MASRMASTLRSKVRLSPVPGRKMGSGMAEVEEKRRRKKKRRNKESKNKD
jgi:hypothetical protein